MTLPHPDRRLHAYDPDTRLAEEALRGQFPEDWHYVSPRPAWAATRVSLRSAPDVASPQVTEALTGEPLEVLWENAGGWAMTRTRHDGYLGWARLDTLAHQGPEDSALVVSALRGHAFAGPKVSFPVLAELALGMRLGRGAGDIVEEAGRRWHPVELPGGQAAWVQEVVLRPLAPVDPVTLALRFLETPYVWGGRSAWGLDCSGLTQLVYAACGRSLPRDADQQQEALRVVDTPAPGDLAFFPGHVGLMLDERRMIHANALHMRVTVETLGEGMYGQRLQASCSGFGRWPA
ncbi:NlpC/P60 family protein [Deinococcus navajonensis]|uniref:NlpC/P60 family protein n=1 Tax=Deinococcus navajonensis TaxID=309884 RepID=A0ABV8XIT0_9DEIO